MENKKLLKFLLKDLSELEELLGEKRDNNLDELEMEFLQTRIGGAKRIVQILFDKEGAHSAKKEIVAGIVEVEREVNVEPEAVIVEEAAEEVSTVEEEIQDEIVTENLEREGVTVREDETETEPEPELAEPAVTETSETQNQELQFEPETVSEMAGEKEVELDEEEEVGEANQRLGDSFQKEKSVNDLIDLESENLEHKLSNRPVDSIRSAIGINDKFQFIRELFDGDATVFVNAVAELDTKKDINEAVDYLKQNFKWKKNEISLKFVNLVKRRFSNE